MHHPTDRIEHTTAFVTPVVEQWLEQEIAQWVYESISRVFPMSVDLYITIQRLMKAIGIAINILRKATLKSAAVISHGCISLSFLPTSALLDSNLD